MAETGQDIAKAKKILGNGGLVAIPTETVYGLAGNALDATVVTRIFTVKNRPHFDPLIVHVHSIDQAARHVQSIPAKAAELARQFWPGPLTLLLDKNETIPDIVTSGLPRVGLRCPDHELTRELLRQLDFPLAAPSANPFGYVSPTRASHVNEQLGDQVDYILDGGPCRVGIESTIVGFEGMQAVLYRSGAIGIEQLVPVTGAVLVSGDTSRPAAPGQLKSHYAPTRNLILGNLPELLIQFAGHSAGLLSYTTHYPGVPSAHQIILSPSGQLEEAARNLFWALRELDKMDIEIILAEEVPDSGIGRAINDRLRRAAAVK